LLGRGTRELNDVRDRQLGAGMSEAVTELGPLGSVKDLGGSRGFIERRGMKRVDGCRGTSP
jgi:hypothetical protein